MELLPPGLIVINFCAFSFSVLRLSRAVVWLLLVFCLGPAPSSQIQISADEDADRDRDSKTPRARQPVAETAAGGAALGKILSSTHDRLVMK